MIRSLVVLGVLFPPSAFLPAGLLAQSKQRSDRQIGEQVPEARLRRAYREKAVAKIGPDSRSFVETYGDSAVSLIETCSRPVSAKLVGFHNSGALAKLPRPHDLLTVIADPRHGDDVALWAIEHAGELADMDSFDAYLATPLDYAMNLKSLQAGAAEIRAARFGPSAGTAAQPDTWKSLLNEDRVGFACFVGLIVIVLWGRWRKRQLRNL